MARQLDMQYYSKSKRSSSKSLDTLTPRERSKRMSLVKGKDTKVEMVVRRLVHGLGFRYRLHSADLPGKPDLVFRTRKKIIFIHGCFWHRHAHCKLARLPKSKLDFWVPKLQTNKERDKKNQKKLTRMGWKYLVIWECELSDLEALRKRVKKFMKQK